VIYAAVERFATGINTQVIKCLRSVSPTACQNSAEILAQEACVQQKSYEESGMHRSRLCLFVHLFIQDVENLVVRQTFLSQFAGSSEAAHGTVQMSAPS